MAADDLGDQGQPQTGAAMSRPAHATISATNALPKVVRGKGSYLWDATGKQYIDGSGGPAVYCLGHAHPEVNRAICMSF